MTREYRFVQVDVFTERIFGGNPLAVFPDGRGLTGGEMQAIALEMNLSETTFVLPATRADCPARVRIFTPVRELAFAGHPTLGTSWVLANEGLLPAGTRDFNLEEGIGPVPVTLEGDPRNPSFVWMRHRDAIFGPPLSNRAAVAAAVGLTEADLLPDAPIRTGSTGNVFLYVPLRNQQAVDRAVADTAALAALLGTSLGVFVLAPASDPGAGRVYSRMFAPHQGVPEDPATGSASGALGAYLVQHNLVKSTGPTRIVSEQGKKMGRPSFVHVTLRSSGDGVTDIRVGGGVVPVLEGHLRLP